MFQAGGNVVAGLDIENFSSTSGNGYGIVLDGSTDPANANLIEANFIGINSSGTTAQGNDAGILIDDSANNTIGGFNGGQGLIEGNLISGNAESGIFIEGAASTGNVIEGNYIGTDVTGRIGVGNGFDGIFMGTSPANPFPSFPSNNSVTSLDPADNQYEADYRNIIAGNGQNGVYILGGTGNLVQGAYIGIGSDGLTPVPNGEDGVRIEDGNSNEVGGIVSGSGNVISANAHNGVEIMADQTSEQGVIMPDSLQNAQNNLVEQNLIGTDSTGTTSSALDVLGNGQDGVALTENNPAGFVSGNVIGGTDASDGILDGKDEAGNLISGNLANGVYLLGDAVVSNSIEGNRIGTNAAGTAAIPNAHSGVFLDRIASEPFGPGQNTIGGTAVGAGNQISGNGTPATSSQAAFGDGITINLGSDGNTISGNLIGTDGTGLLRLGNAANGVAIDNSSGNMIGAQNVANVISANGAAGVDIAGSASQGNLVQTNWIGLGVDVATPLSNLNGVQLEAGTTNNTIGGTTKIGGQSVTQGNVIAANTLDGIDIITGANNNVISYNTIGTNNTQDAMIGNGGNGIFILNSANNTIGASQLVGNVIAGNSSNGIEISDTGNGTTAPTATGNIILGNYIGLKNDGATALPNSGNGVLLDNAASNTIGGTATGAQNVISGNGQDGVLVQGAFGQSNTVAGNLIGTTADGNSALGNGPQNPGAASGTTASGVVITTGASQNTIGLPGVAGANVISGNAVAGVEISGAGANTVENDVLGCNASGSAALLNQPAQQYGIVIVNTPNTMVGGDSFALDGDLISGNLQIGIFIVGSGSVGTKILNNAIGTDATISKQLGNAHGGVALGANGSFGAHHQFGHHGKCDRGQQRLGRDRAF